MEKTINFFKFTPRYFTTYTFKGGRKANPIWSILPVALGMKHISFLWESAGQVAGKLQKLWDVTYMQVTPGPNHFYSQFDYVFYNVSIFYQRLKLIWTQFLQILWECKGKRNSHTGCLLYVHLYLFKEKMKIKLKKDRKHQWLSAARVEGGGFPEEISKFEKPYLKRVSFIVYNTIYCSHFQ